ncbi:hypothetical protein EUTSA_v10015524mg [Eutrema salsugineum]|uniref:FBD domain-containing protein n=1 Tax=Eutrema salsugineum TaxID=72664 RepID=V4NAD5_EUTSA|nr:FBD-associated F-box protein At4g10400 [Eutrema salsugineum]ESQ42781.1 hypothetical protein EUTSA_v10015524mg [Eutrema salsugineum]
MDRISGLSDELLVIILSFLPTKMAVSTSILSKRWEHLWRWLPKLEYDDQNCSESSQCKRLKWFLLRGLALHRAPVIESLRLKITNPYFKPDVMRLMVASAAFRNVRELDIHYSSFPGKSNILPINFYTKRSLVFLKLDGGIFLDNPDMVCFHSLKTLQLQGVAYFNEETLQRLLSSCPALEELLVDISEDDKMRKFTIIVPTLQRLSLYIPYFYDIDGFVIKTPSLKYLKLKDHNDKSHYCLIDNMPNLIEAYVDVECPDIKSLIGSITSVKRLTICSEALYGEGFVFRQLEHLKQCRCKEFSSKLLVSLLNDSPKVRELELFEMHDHYYNGMIKWNQPDTVPGCILSSLQILNWSVYTGAPDERNLAVYILKNATHLKTTTIYSEECHVPKFEMIKELALSSRASTTCQLVFD